MLDDGDFWQYVLAEPVPARGEPARRPDRRHRRRTTRGRESYAALVDRVARSGADGVVLGGDPFDGGDRS